MANGAAGNSNPSLVNEHNELSLDSNLNPDEQVQWLSERESENLYKTLLSKEKQMSITEAAGSAMSSNEYNRQTESDDYTANINNTQGLNASLG